MDAGGQGCSQLWGRHLMVCSQEPTRVHSSAFVSWGRPGPGKRAPGPWGTQGNKEPFRLFITGGVLIVQWLQSVRGTNTSFLASATSKGINLSLFKNKSLEEYPLWFFILTLIRSNKYTRYTWYLKISRNKSATDLKRARRSGWAGVRPFKRLLRWESSALPGWSATPGHRARAVPVGSAVLPAVPRGERPLLAGWRHRNLRAGDAAALCSSSPQSRAPSHLTCTILGAAFL